MEPHLNYPPDADLRKLLRFEPDSGAIWLGERRMVLLHTAALSALRRDLITSVGTEHTRRLLTRMGYASGAHDAGFAHKTRGNRSLEEMFMVGPQLHMLEGAARVTPLHLKMDAATGLYEGEFRWDDSWEAHAHRLAYGVVDEPACWILLGYASGYTSAFMGKLILFKEIKCGACGDDHCHIVGKPIDEWPDGEAYRPYFEDDSLLHKLDVLSQQVEALKTTLEPATSGGMLIGASPAFQHAHDLMQRAARTQVTVLLTGETGVGKERFARALHEHSDRATGPFVAVNCAALPAELIEAELFGVEKGAYTGAHAARAGRFERAEGGTLFLDEVGDLPLAAQAKLLRVLQEGEIERLGAEATRKVNVRMVTATNVDLEAAVAQGRFRRDLLYRLNVYPICIPPLRERSADIEPLARHLLARFMALHNKRLSGLGDRALQALMRHDWPGNVRELENLVERGVILAAQGGAVELEHLFPNQPGARQEGVDPQGRLARVLPAGENELCERIVSSGLSLEQLESRVLALAVERSGGNLSGAARLLGLTRPQLAYRLKRQQIDEESS
ncbi:MAG TPA: sigma-54-dependent Fis family transcriptional regulator [Hydrogenophaga sp.]|uniref:sigma-54-dependent Fis family transcriptional regulator n=1 Tax=Hydrogenophaga sp. TaxID=1904254 RepID=UPI0008B195A8|nr:sigma-54-dependent Fis family transcriptional regulator [Hydrogenophaga sp.]MBU4181153.1 sigma 54-interacting transcriptional regulator [Gammaproteobacteria bacterium]OGA78242.1 MAG: sigma-54-dependent Fis family transcriptional regulator [Burkholderiales bacterium GWE1_65_30]OGA93144.1 MAG: sigma-54-dependent Fis family transcriptional regulator [Burkholderiales bacterium GWF1_66_17]OGB33995.1 MAG: sigma-54-dependent Fis family transcriptional regulator [Burkholderiales bacterium RIFCSPLOWO